MSEQGNIEVLKSLYDAFNSGDLQAVLAKVAPGAEWIDFGPKEVPYFGDFSGRVPAFFQAIGESVTHGSAHIDEFVASGDTVVTRGRWNAIVRTNGAKIDADMVHFFKLHDGKITSWKGYSDTAAVLAGHIGKAASMAR